MTGVRRFAQWGLWFGGALVLLAAVLIGIDVLMRKFLARSIGGADELAGYALAIGTAWGLGAALLDRAHIRIDSLYVLFPRKLRLRSISPALVLFLAFFALIAWHGLGRGLAVLDLGLAQPVRARDADGHPAGALDRRAARLSSSSACCCSSMRAAGSWRRAICAAVAQLIGTRSAEEEVEDEIRDLKERAEREGRD